MPFATACVRPAAIPSLTAVYQPRRPERTVVYQVVTRRLEAGLEVTRGRDPDVEPVPVYIERDFRRDLTCGILAHGFARARCVPCGHDFQVTSACKERGASCPSCTTRRTAETAAHLVEHLLRRVLLFDERAKVVVRETWSDPVTGAYAFEHLNPDIRYLVIAYDHRHNYRAVIADNLTAEPMP